MRGKKGGVACGDFVEIKATTPGQGVIEQIKPRKALLYRSDAFKEKIIAANVTQIIIVVAAEPSFSEELINRCLVAAESEQIKAILVLNKADLTELSDVAAKKLSLYEIIGYPLVKISALQDVSPLRPYLEGQVSVLAGQSGMGKSTILNALIPEAQRATAEISVALDSGCHTTTHTHLYHIDSDSDIIDSPGIQAFGLNHIKVENLAWGFIEFHPHIGQCKFHNCKHVNEPGCALIQAAEEGKITTRRLDFYHKLLQN
ncbi:MAG: ribosome small subunit-dependent GTPase A [Burkholderiales bacterium]|nr:ribosome small subunit-dependent GTPase A [Nitrosomonas sp.]MCP5273297.1 ribosome small subunit-dependent GTPase A [Burkholderiales bacterium]